MNKILIDNYNYLNFKDNETVLLNSIEFFNDEIKKIIFNDDLTDVYINVNIKFHDRNRQCNAGVELWRNTFLKEYDCEIRKVKFHFYSFLCKEKCVEISGGRDIVLLYDDIVEFFRLPFNIETQSTPILNKVGNFNKSINNNYSKISYSSESLLSGWGINVYDNMKNSESKSFSIDLLTNYKINNRNKKILIIDDRILEWEVVLRNIFVDEIEYFKFSENEKDLLHKIKKEEMFKYYSKDFDVLFQNIDIKSFDLIFLDIFYNSVNEFHESNKRLDENQINNITGNKILKYFAKRFTYIPTIMFTSSTKVWNYKYFFKSGAMDWWTKIGKNILIDNESRKDTFIEFYNIIEKYLSEPYTEFKDVWGNAERSINNISRINSSKNIINKLSDGDIANIKIILKKSYNFMKYIDKSIEKYYVASAIVEQLGNIVEIIYKQWERHKMTGLNKYFDAMKCLRNHASHSTFTEIDIYDVILSFALIRLGIENIDDSSVFFHLLKIDDDSPDLIYKYKLFFLYKSIYKIGDKELNRICEYKFKNSLGEDNDLRSKVKDDKESINYIKLFYNGGRNKHGGINEKEFLEYLIN